MKNFFKVIFSILFVCASVLTPFFGASFAGNNFASATVSQTATLTVFEEIMRDVKITQDGYIFSARDFEIKENSTSNKTEYYLYVNTSVTITHNTSNYFLNITVNKLNENYPEGKLLSYGQTYTIGFDGSAETIYEVDLFQWYTSGGGKTFKFYLVQTPVNFSVNATYFWKDRYNLNVVSPSPNDPYTDKITLHNIIGTETSPIYLDFYFNGEFYSIYNINGVFYNTLTGNPLSETSLEFNIPGQYELYLYDKTCYNRLKTITLWQKTENEQSFKIFDKESPALSSYANCKSFKFSIVQSYANQTSANMYLLAKDDEGNTIVNNQTVNTSVNLTFNNLDGSKIRVGKIEVLKFSASLTGSNTPSTEVIYPDKYSKLSDLPTITYSEDSSYAVNIYDQYGNTIWNESFKFTILKDIHNSYGTLNSTDRTLVPSNNTIYEIAQTESHSTSFKGFHETVTDPVTTVTKIVYLQSSTSTSYTVKLARASTSIDGISNGDSTNQPVLLTVHGVGDITVQIYRDGSLVDTRTLTDGETIDQDAVGSYDIRITDQMGTVLSKSFKINRSLNGATIALIVISAVAVAIFIFVVVKLRTRIKVR